MNTKNKLNETQYNVSKDAVTDFISKTKGKLAPTDVVSVDSNQKVSTTTNSPSTSITTGIHEDGALPPKLRYLSNIKDTTTGKVSEPFEKKGKKYQMVRSIGPDDEIMTGVYSLDEIDEDGENKIYTVEYFEKNFADDVEEEPVSVEGDMVSAQENSITPPQEVLKPTNKLNPLNLSEFKHFFVDTTTGKVRKFKTDEELAKATIGETESYMKIHDFKKFVDETVFGSRKKGLQEDDLGAEENDLHAKAAKLMKLISTKIPSQVIDQIKNNKIAQKEVVLSFAELIGIPRAMLTKVITGIKDQVKQDSVTQPEPMNERKLITKKSFESSIAPKVSTTIKVKNFK